MSEIEKMYENAEVDKMCDTFAHWMQCNWKTRQCEDCEHFVYPLFTAEKQIEILKRLIFHNRAMLVFLDCVPSLKEYRNDDSFNKHFAKNIGTLWQDLTEAEQEEIRKILQG